MRMTKVRAELKEVPTTSGRFNLTPAEARAADLALEGMTNRAIAEATHTTEQTVKNRMHAVYDKVGCGNRAEFVLIALRGGGQ